jgi:hypothetical protein
MGVAESMKVVAKKIWEVVLRVSGGHAPSANDPTLPREDNPASQAKVFPGLRYFYAHLLNLCAPTTMYAGKLDRAMPTVFEAWANGCRDFTQATYFLPNAK